MKDAFKTKARDAARDFNIETATRLIKPTLLRQPAVSAIFHTLPPRLRDSTQVRLATFSDTVFISCMMSNLDGFKDPRLTTLLSRFADEGWKATSNDYTSGDVPNRDYTFTRRFTWEHDTRAVAYKKLIKEGLNIPQTFEITVTISAWVKEDSPTCRIVTKEREETVVKIDKFIVCE